MLGLNQRVRNTPLSSSTTKLQSATSPSMNDQWSGKTLRRLPLPSLARPSRSSAHVAAAPTFDGLAALAGLRPLPRAKGRRLAVSVVDISCSPAFPETRSDRLGEIALSGQVALVVHHQR